MNNLDNEIKEKVKEMIEWVLEPIGVKVLGFINSYEMTHRSKMGNESWKEWKERIYLIELEKSGEKFIENISELHLKNSTMDAVWVMCHDYCYGEDVSDPERDAILTRLWSEEFLKMRDNQKV